VVISEAFAALATPVTLAPRCLASWTAFVPTAPEAPFTSTDVPGPTDALSREKNNAVVPPNSSPAASSWVTPDGLRASFFAGTATYSASALILIPVMPHTSSPGARSPTREPTTSTTPEKELPRIGRRGRTSPNIKRAKTPNPTGNRSTRMRTSSEVIATALTRTKTSSARGSGRRSSAT
jgi:hypothetical protein